MNVDSINILSLPGAILARSLAAVARFIPDVSRAWRRTARPNTRSHVLSLLA